jgi:hypothetical protein
LVEYLKLKGDPKKDGLGEYLKVKGDPKKMMDWLNT